MITREDLDKMIEKNTSERYLGTGRINCYKRGAQSIAPLLLKALSSLQLQFKRSKDCARWIESNHFENDEYDGYCYVKSTAPFNELEIMREETKEVITEIESMINKQGEK